MLVENLHVNLLPTHVVGTGDSSIRTLLLVLHNLVQVQSHFASKDCVLALVVHQGYLRGGQGADAVSKFSSAYGTLFYLLFAGLADNMTSLAAGHGGLSWDCETYGTLQTGLYLCQEVILVH